MATSLQATKVLEALKQARNIGRVEEAATIDGCSLVVQNLAPADFDAIHLESQELDDILYLNAYQMGHVCRAIVEIAGEDLRGVQFIEDEVPSGAYAVAAYLSSEEVAEKVAEEIKKAGGKATVMPPGGEPRTIKLERHEWLRNNVLSSWGREAVVVAWRKVMDVIAAADEKAREGVQFKVPDESPEERFRRLIGELKETEEDLPAELVNAVLAEVGYQTKTTAAEMEAVDEKLQGLESTQQGSQEPSGGPAEAEVAPTTPEPPKAAERPPEPLEPPPPPPPADPADLMRNRRPLNQRAAVPPVPQSAPTAPATRPAQVPEQIRKAAEANAAALSPTDPGVPARAAQIAALEAQADPTIAGAPQATPPRQPHTEEVAELSRKSATVDGGELRKIVDQPPVAGINPRFRKAPGT